MWMMFVEPRSPIPQHPSLLLGQLRISCPDDPTALTVLCRTEPGIQIPIQRLRNLREFVVTFQIVRATGPFAPIFLMLHRSELQRPATRKPTPGMIGSVVFAMDPE